MITGSLLIITGTMGAGKTSVLGEASDILRLQGIAHAAIDVDALGLAFLPATTRNDDAMYCNLRSVCNNYAALGVMRFLLARALESRRELDICRGMVPGAHAAVCRITASVEMMEARVKMREAGKSRMEYVSRVAELDAILDRERLEDFSVANGNRLLTEVAQEMLVRAAWISG